MKRFKFFPRKQRSVSRPLKLNIIGDINTQTYQYVSDALLHGPAFSEIILVINSPGGSTIDALAIYELLKSTNLTITTIALGNCSSSATILFALGSKRLIAHNTKYLLHQGSFHPAANCYLPLSKLREIVNNIETLDEIIKDKLRATCSKNISEFLETTFSCPKDTVLTCEETIQLGLATNIFDLASTPI